MNISYSPCNLCGTFGISTNFSGADSAPVLDCRHQFHQRCIEKYIIENHISSGKVFCPVDDCLEFIDQKSEVFQTSLSNRHFYEVGEPVIYISLASVLLLGATGVFGKKAAILSQVSGYFSTGFAALGLTIPATLTLLSGVGLAAYTSCEMTRACS